MSKAELVLDELNRFSLYPWVMQRRYNEVEYKITVPMPYSSYGGFFAMREADLERLPTLAVAARILETVALDFGLHYLRQPNVPDRSPFAQRARGFAQ